MGDAFEVIMHNTFLEVKSTSNVVLFRSLSAGDLPRSDSSSRSAESVEPSEASPSGSDKGAGNILASESCRRPSTTLPQSTQTRRPQCHRGGRSRKTEPGLPVSARPKVAAAGTAAAAPVGTAWGNMGTEGKRWHEVGDSRGEDDGFALEPEIESTTMTAGSLIDLLGCVTSMNDMMHVIHADPSQMTCGLAGQALRYLVAALDWGMTLDDPEEWQSAAIGLGRLIACIPASSMEIVDARTIVQVVWCFGKLNLCDANVVAVLEYFEVKVKSSPRMGFAASELVNTLWALGRLADKWPGCRCVVKRFSKFLIQESKDRLSELSPQELSTALWSIAKLRLGAVGLVGAFAKGCMAELCREHCFCELSTTELVSCLWAVARIRLDIQQVSSLCAAILREVDLEEIRKFTTTELSIASWAVAKMTRKCVRRTSNRSVAGADATQESTWILLAMTQESISRAHEFGPEGWRNICWALTTLELTGHAHVRPLLDAACLSFPFRTEAFDNQDINSLC